MAFAEANRTSLYFSEETTWGETPSSPTMLELQFTSITGGHKKQTVVPTTIRSDRMQESLVRVGENAEFGFNFELRHTQYDNVIAAIIAATAFTTVSLTATDISAAASDQSFNSVAGAFVSAGIVPGMWIKVAGFTGAGVSVDNGIFKVVTVTTTKVVVIGGTTLVDDAAGESVTITAKMARNGIAKRSFFVEQRHADITQFAPYTGVRFNQLDLTMNNRSLITGALSCMGKQGVPQATSQAGSSTAAASNVGMDTSNNVLAIFEAGVAITTPVFNASLSITNNLAIQPALSNRFPIGIRYGTLEVTGRIEVYFQDIALLTKFVNHTATDLLFKLRDDNSKTLYLTVPRIQFSEGDIPVTGENSDILLSLPFRASYSSTLSNVIQIDSLA